MKPTLTLLLTFVLMLGCNPNVDEGEAVSQLESNMADSDLAEATFDRILQHYGNDVDPSKIPEAHRVVLAVLHSRGILGNGGFQYLFEGELTGDPNYLLTREAYKTIGATDSLAAFDKAYAVFPNSIPPKDIEKRLTTWQANYNLIDSLEDDSSPDSMYYESVDDAMHKLTGYIETHPEEFADLN